MLRKFKSKEEVYICRQVIEKNAVLLGVEFSHFIVRALCEWLSSDVIYSLRNTRQMEPVKGNIPINVHKEESE